MKPILAELALGHDAVLPLLARAERHSRRHGRADLLAHVPGSAINKHLS